MTQLTKETTTYHGHSRDGVNVSNLKSHDASTLVGLQRAKREIEESCVSLRKPKETNKVLERPGNHRAFQRSPCLSGGRAASIVTSRALHLTAFRIELTS